MNNFVLLHDPDGQEVYINLSCVVKMLRDEDRTYLYTTSYDRLSSIIHVTETPSEILQMRG